MSTLAKQRFAVGFVFTFFLAIGFTASLSIAGLSAETTDQQIAKKSQQATSKTVLARTKTKLDLAGLRVEK